MPALTTAATPAARRVPTRVPFSVYVADSTTGPPVIHTDVDCSEVCAPAGVALDRMVVTIDDTGDGVWCRFCARFAVDPAVEPADLRRAWRRHSRLAGPPQLIGIKGWGASGRPANLAEWLPTLYPHRVTSPGYFHHLVAVVPERVEATVRSLLGGWGTYASTQLFSGGPLDPGSDVGVLLDLASGLWSPEGFSAGSPLWDLVEAHAAAARLAA